MADRRKIVAILAIAVTAALVACALIEIDWQRTIDAGMARPAPELAYCDIEPAKRRQPNTVCVD